MAQKNRRAFFTVPRFEKIPFLVHGFGTKLWKEDDFLENPVFRNLRLISLRQVHSGRVHCIQEFPEKKLQGDALLTNRPGFLLVISTADCLPVFVADEGRKAVAAVHCGWRGTQARVLQNAIHGLESCFGSRPSDLIVGMGPAIGGKCYEVGEDVRQSFSEKGHSLQFFQNASRKKGKYFFDLKEANRHQILEAGVRKDRIFSLEICTHCDQTLLSYRRDKKTLDRMINFIGIQD